MDNTEVKQQTIQQRTTAKPAMIIAALMIGYSLIYMDKSMVPLAIIPISEEFALNKSQAGLIMSAFFLGYSLLQIPGGWLADKLGAKRVLLTSLAVIAGVSLAFGLSSGLMLFILIRCVAGFGHAGYPPSCSKSIAENFPQEKRTFVQSLVLSTAGIGGMLAYLVGSRLIDMNWRTGYYVLGFLFVLAFVCMLLFLPNRGGADAQATKTNVKKISLGKVLSDKRVLTLFVAMLLLNFLLYGISSWLPSFLTTRFSLEIGTVSTILAVNSLLHMTATLMVGRLLSSVFMGKEKPFLIATTVAASLAISGVALINYLPIAVMCLYIGSMTSISAFICLFTWPHKILDKDVIGSSIGVINTGGTLGGFLAPYILGTIITNTGGDFTPAFIAMAVAGLLAGATGMFVKK